MESLVMRQKLQSFYKGKKVFLTGHTGFKGIWISALLYQLGAKVKGYSLAPENSKPFFDLFISNKLNESIIGDIRDRERIKKEIISFEPDYIFHLAAQSLVLRSYEIPAETFDINVLGTANILEAIHALDKKCTTVIITTDKVYENKEQDILYKEEDRLGGYDPYSSSKACVELVTNSFRNSFFPIDNFAAHQKALVSARAGNVIGGGDWSQNRIIPDIARSLLRNEAIKIRNPDAVRPWQHVLEPLTGYLLLGGLLNEQSDLYSHSYNFGPMAEDHLTVKELADLAVKIWGNGKIEFSSNNNQPHEATLLKLDISRAMNDLHWYPKLNAEEAIRWTIEWYKTADSKQAERTFKQIENYLDK